MRGEHTEPLTCDSTWQLDSATASMAAYTEKSCLFTSCLCASIGTAAPSPATEGGTDPSASESPSVVSGEATDGSNGSEAPDETETSPPLRR